MEEVVAKEGFKKAGEDCVRRHLAGLGGDCRTSDRAIGRWVLRQGKQKKAGDEKERPKLRLKDNVI